GTGEITAVFNNKKQEQKEKQVQKDINLKNIELHIIKNALAKNEFFTFNSLKFYFPYLKSTTDFIVKNEYLAGLSITFKGIKRDIDCLNNQSKFLAVLKLLEQVEKEIKDNLTDFKGSNNFIPYLLKKVFIDKTIRIKKDSQKLDGQKEFLEDKNWYVFNANYGTSEEKALVKLIDRQIEELRKKFKEIYLVRNERQLKIFNFKDGQAFEPDYLLFLIKKNGKSITYQLFLEPKGKHLVEGEKWKSQFLEEIKERFKDKTWEFPKLQRLERHKIIGVPFYTNEDENDFKENYLKV
ncbi:unnamed protein product, partial [marine sediment metagenome]